MKNVFAGLLLLIHTHAIGGELKEYDVSETKWTQAYVYVNETGQRLTGIVRNHYPDGTLKAYVELKDGVSHGKEIHYYKNGQKRHEVIFENGVSKSEWKFWFPDGRLMSLEDQKQLPEIDKKYS